MFVVIFEVRPRRERWEEYLALARALRPRLEAVDGFIDNERFLSARGEGRLLSLSTWRDEKAVVRWRTHAEHHRAQQRGRREIFADYHLRVGEVTADSSPPTGVPVAQQRFDETEAGAARCVTVSELVPERGRTVAAAALAAGLGLDAAAPGLIDHEAFESITERGRLVLLASWRDAAAAAAWSPRRPEAAAALRHRSVRIIRDYGMADRREAPQFHPDAGTEA